MTYQRTLPLENIKAEYEGMFSPVKRQFRTVYAMRVWLTQVGKLGVAKITFDLDGEEYRIHAMSMTDQNALVFQPEDNAMMRLSFNQIETGRFNAV